MPRRIITVVLILFSVACNRPGKPTNTVAPPSNKNVEQIILPDKRDSSHGYNFIVLADGFNDEIVQMLIDDSLVFSSTAKTDPILGIAGEIPYVRAGKPSHRIDVRIVKEAILRREKLIDTNQVMTLVNLSDSVIDIQTYNRILRFK
jgi:hypothetical protein